jgi:hypothetical protein
VRQTSQRLTKIARPERNGLASSKLCIAHWVPEVMTGMHTSSLD